MPRTSDDTTQLPRALTCPTAYPHPVEEVRLLQTHISWLFFAGERVYKVKKPVDLGFLDFTTPERRRHFCEEEVRLNRRLAPNVYLGVVPITRDERGALRIDGDGEAVDWAVAMHRLPAHRMLSELLERGEIDNAELDAMAALLVEFHAACPSGPGVDEHGSPAAVRANVEANFEALRHFAPPPEHERAFLSALQLGFLRARARAFLEARAGLFEQRVADGAIREGHGDLHSGNLCFTQEGIVAYDCIEFSRALRCGDIASDVAFLAMDLDDRGYPGFSRYLLKRYAARSGDGGMAALFDFYKAYRAGVRAKVAALTADEASLPEARREELRLEARRYVQLAVGYSLPPTLILTCGLPASGKSWVARHLARPLRARVLRSDVRRRLPDAAPPAGAARYSPERKRATYESLLTAALHDLASRRSVIVDATFARRVDRALFVDAAQRLALPWLLVHVTAPEDVVRERMQARAGDPRAVSEADFDVYLAERARFEDPRELPEPHVLRLASGGLAPERQTSSIVDRVIALANGAR